MAAKRRIKFNIRGAGARPDSIGMGELGNILNHLEAAIKGAIPPEVRVDRSDTSDPLVSLVSLQEGNSSDMEMAVLDYGLPALGDITEAIATNDYAKMPMSSHDEMASISKWIARRKFEFVIVGDAEADIRHVVISRKHPVPSPATSNKVDGVTTAWGYLFMAGGIKPSAAIRFPDGSKVRINADEQVAKELGARLYEDVGIEGIATWRTSDWKIVAFKALKVLDYSPQKVSLTQTFKELTEASNGRWNNIDAIEYVREIRGEPKKDDP